MYIQTGLHDVKRGLRKTVKQNGNAAHRKDRNITKVLMDTSVDGKNGEILESLQKSHKRYARKLMSSLYAFFPVYYKYTIDKNGGYTRKYTIGGNTPIVRELAIKDKVEKLEVVNEDFDNAYTYTVETGKGKRYGKIEDIISLSSKNNVNFIKTAINEGLFFDKDMNIVSSKTEGATKYKIFIWSSSNERNVEALFINAEKFPGNTSMELIDRVSGETFSANLPKDGEIPFNKFEKIGKRLGILHTPAIEAAKALHIVFVDGDLKGPDDMDLDSQYLKTIGYEGSLEEFFKERNLENDTNTYDGACYLGEGMIKRTAEMLNIDIPNYMIRLTAVQNRKSVLLDKVFAETHRQEVLESMRDYAFLLRDKGLVKGVYEIGDRRTPIDLVIDTNGAKLPNLKKMFSNDFEGATMYILNVAKASISSLSGQMIEKFMSIDRFRTLKFIKNHTYKKADDILSRKLEKKLSLERNRFGNLELAGDMTENLITVNKNKALTDKSVMKQIVTDKVKWQDSAVRKGAIEIDSTYHHVLFDGTKMITVDKIDNILGVDLDLKAVQAFSQDIIVKNAKLIAAIENNPKLSKAEKKARLDVLLTAVIIKYPTPGKEEYEIVRYLTKAEILDLINQKIANISMSITPEEANKLRRLLTQYFFETAFGVVKLAPINILKNKLAGMDTDYDAICSIFQRELVEIALDKSREQDSNGSLVSINYSLDGLILPDDEEEEVFFEEEEEVEIFKNSSNESKSVENNTSKKLEEYTQDNGVVVSEGKAKF